MYMVVPAPVIPDVEAVVVICTAHLRCAHVHIAAVVELMARCPPIVVMCLNPGRGMIEEGNLCPGCCGGAGAKQQFQEYRNKYYCMDNPLPA